MREQTGAGRERSAEGRELSLSESCLLEMGLGRYREFSGKDWLCLGGQKGGRYCLPPLEWTHPSMKAWGTVLLSSPGPQYPWVHGGLDSETSGVNGWCWGQEEAAPGRRSRAANSDCSLFQCREPQGSGLGLRELPPGSGLQFLATPNPPTPEHCRPISEHSLTLPCRCTPQRGPAQWQFSDMH